MPSDHYCAYENRWGELSEYHKNTTEKLDQILEQALLTNGRVRKLETFRLISTVGFIVAMATVVFMLIAHSHGWIEAIITYGGAK